MRRFVDRNLGVPRDVATIITGNVMQSLRRYFLGVTYVAAFNAIVVGIAAVLLDVPLAGTIAVVVFVTAYVPFIGAFVSGAFAVILTLSSQGTTAALIMLVVVILANGLLQNIVQPIAFGATLDLNPLVVLIVTIGFGSIFGMIGLVLAAPLTSAALHISRELAQAKALEAAAEAERPPTEPEPARGHLSFARLGLERGEALAEEQAAHHEPQHDEHHRLASPEPHAKSQQDGLGAYGRGEVSGERSGNPHGADRGEQGSRHGRRRRTRARVRERQRGAERERGDLRVRSGEDDAQATRSRGGEVIDRIDPRSGGLLRRSRRIQSAAAIRRNVTPRTISGIAIQSGSESEIPAASTSTTNNTASVPTPTTQPARNESPFAACSGQVRSSRIAPIGTGLTATATA